MVHLRLVRYGVAAVQMCRARASVAGLSDSASQSHTDDTKSRTFVPTFASVYPDMLPTRVQERRNRLREMIERQDMMNRRVHLDIPEFYVGSIIAVTCADKFAPSRQLRFLGIVTERLDQGLRHRIMVRNAVDGMGVQYAFDIYSPTVLKIEVIKLQRHADHHMRYLRDAPVESYTFAQNMPAVPRAPGAPVPECTLVVKLKPPPWTQQWQRLELKGVDNESCWSQITPWYKRKFYRTIMYAEDKYDIVKHYREMSNRDEQLTVYEHMHAFEQSTDGVADEMKRQKRRALFPSIETTGKKKIM